ncbi:hypothetical protein Droror1_Dr00025750 [Drosera rotundifolia]
MELKCFFVCVEIDGLCPAWWAAGRFLDKFNNGPVFFPCPEILGLCNVADGGLADALGHCRSASPDVAALQLATRAAAADPSLRQAGHGQGESKQDTTACIIFSRSYFANNREQSSFFRFWPPGARWTTSGVGKVR